MKHEENRANGHGLSGRRCFGRRHARGCWTITAAVKSSDPLPSWNDGPAKQAIVEFVAAVTTEGGADFVRPRTASPPSIRTARSGSSTRSTARGCSRSTAWPRWRPSIRNGRTKSRSRRCSRATARRWPSSPRATEWRSSAPPTPGSDHRAVREDRPGLAGQGQGSGFKRPSTELIYQPMLEVMEHLRANGFRTYIVTGGGQEFVRIYSERVYGVPVEQVVGSSIATKYETGRQAGADARAQGFFIDDRPARRSASTCSSASGRTPRSATPTAIARCWNGPAPATARG